MTLRCRSVRWALLLTGASLVTAPGSVRAQGSATVRIEENVRREPNGVVLSRLLPGTGLRVLSSEGNWTEVEMEGWVWLRSLQASSDPAFDLVVSATGGENLRSGPSGTILGRLEEGALLTEVERNPAWAVISRTGWIWTASLGSQAPSGAASSATAPAPRAQPEGPSARAPGGFASVGAVGGPILAAPDGDTLALASPSSDIEVMGREGNWVRVRLEGWMWMPPTQQTSANPLADAPVAVEPAALIADPDAYAGRVVSWTIQFISLERAEAVRTDFFEGEPFLLARFGGGDGPFVYVAIPADRLGEVEGLVPLERISVTGRIRTVASSLTGAPIIDLIAVERLREVP